MPFRKYFPHASAGLSRTLSLRPGRPAPPLRCWGCRDALKRRRANPRFPGTKLGRRQGEACGVRVSQVPRAHRRFVRAALEHVERFVDVAERGRLGEMFVDVEDVTDEVAIARNQLTIGIRVAGQPCGRQLAQLVLELRVPLVGLRGRRVVVTDARARLRVVLEVLGDCRSSQLTLTVPKGALAMFTNTASVVFCSA